MNCIKEIEKSWNIPAKLPVNKIFTPLPKKDFLAMRAIFIEEVKETIRAIETNDLVEILDGQADMLFVLYNYSIQIGRSSVFEPNKNLNKIKIHKPIDIAKRILKLANDFEDLAQINDLINWLAERTIMPQEGPNSPSLILYKTLDEVIRSNKTKAEDGKFIFNEKGKIIKGRHYEKPDIQKIIKEHKVVLV